MDPLTCNPRSQTSTQGAEECMRLVRMVGEQDEAAGREARPVILFNPRMSR